MEHGPNTNPTELLQRLADRDESAAAQLFPVIYEDLRGLASDYFRRQEGGHTLQPTALVHEAYAKLAISGSRWEDRAHFYAVAATAMRQILIDHARRKKTDKRGGDRDRVTLSNILTPTGGDEIDVLALNELLTQMEQLDPRQYKVVEMRFFAGASEEEVAEALGVSRTTVQSEWRSAKAWLGKELRKGDTP
ncbi:MAG TPA: sigma-70 family RNA polymerase sigma factor [Phycisphaerae bacterium]|nr:sigma-70 family RNA polymerase sigma factor [Phycisphaerales bacterium]HNO77880.1 sigma-70 family RNA polymerase sigma factor [Phycisphaerae bacterium]